MASQDALPVMDDADRILDEAADWLLELTEKPGDRALAARFRQWLATDARHGEVWSDLNQSYDLVGETEPEMTAHWQTSAVPVHGPRWFRRRERGRREAARPPRPRRAGPIAAVTASVALAVWLAPDAMLAIRADHRTGTGELRTVRLGDGSTARLGPGSAIAVTYAQGERRVDLLAGEALFEVEPSKERPFRVYADNVHTTVLGTGFDVRRLPSATEVGVQHGRVRVDRAEAGTEPVFLAAGDSVTIDEDGTTATNHVSPQLIASWALGEVNARDRTVAEVIEDIRPWYRGRIVLMSSATAARRVNGVYDPRDPAKAIRSLVLPLGATVTQITPWLIVVHG